VVSRGLFSFTGYHRQLSEKLLDKKLQGFNPDDFLLVDDSLVRRLENTRHVGAQGVNWQRPDYQVLNDPKLAPALECVFPKATIPGFLGRFVKFLWTSYVYDLPSLTKKTEYVRIRRVFVRENTQNEGVDGRAEIVGMTKIVANDPVVVHFEYTLGNLGFELSKGMNVSMALVAQIISSPNIHSHELLIEDVDRIINFNIKGMHGVNIAMHDNLTPNVIRDTIEFIKYYIRWKRQKGRDFLRLGEVE